MAQKVIKKRVRWLRLLRMAKCTLLTNPAVRLPAKWTRSYLTQPFAGALGLHWIADGRADDTPPGGALVFELWQSADGKNSVRVYYTTQTLEQMHTATVLTGTNPPVRVPVFVPGCSRAGFSCSLEKFEANLQR